MDPLALARLLQLASPALPVGAYTYSQGLEWAVECGTVRDEAGAGCWIASVLDAAGGRFEAPLLARLLAAWGADDAGAAAHWNAQFIASRETAELRAETLQMGYSCARLLRDLGRAPAALAQLDDIAFPTAWSAAAVAFAVPAEEALTAYLWSWLENQVLAAVKLVPLGQTAGQRLLARLAERIPAVVAAAGDVVEDDFSNFAPGLAIASALHETQHTRLFRS